jgi:hypothetical protein
VIQTRPSKGITYALFSVSIALTGCSSIKFYPVQGPFASRQPPVVLVSTVTGGFRSGRISVTLPDGEVCKGSWIGTSQPDASNSMASTWDVVYGQGYYAAHVLGQNIFGQAMLTGNLGTTLTLELYRPEKKDATNTVVAGLAKGVAKDSKGNIYKVVE